MRVTSDATSDCSSRHSELTCESVHTCITYGWEGGLSSSVDHFNERKAATVHCWESTQLLRAWESAVQVTAISRSKELFPSIKPHQKSPPVRTTGQIEAILEGIEDVEETPAADDAEAYHEGEGFMERGDEVEWEEWFDWDRLGE